MRRPLLFFIAGLVAALAIPVLAQQSAFTRFSDVQSNAYFARDLDFSVGEGILRGYENGRFGPDDPLTRGQMAAILRRYDTNVIQPLRDQIAFLREHLELGSCGDRTTQDGEQCDDGNAVSGDGCSAYCRTEALCGVHKVGESYVGSDGCNRCSCTDRGEVCTLMACPKPNPDPQPDCKPYVCADDAAIPRCSDDGHVINYFADPCLTHGGYSEKCFGDHQCSNGLVCSTRYGDCASACEPGAEACIMACAGYCVQPRDELGTCGNGLCENNEGPSCPPCTYANPPCMAPCTAGTCPDDCDGSNNEGSCAARREEFDAAVSASTRCESDNDCTAFTASCPFVTCGVAVNRSATEKLKRLADALASCLEENGEPVACAMCIPMEVRCVRGQCMKEGE